ncbi:MAG: enolase C-terminal domain-like protein [Myxococcota bacterium]|nr:enolase C-terminal domain-like protein [Myxococcota bacterium]
MRPIRFRLHAIDLPFRRPFKHAAAERRSSDSILLECELEDGTVGFGECLPRAYVTGEARDGTFDQLRDAILPRLLGREFKDLDEVRGFLEACDGRSPDDWVPAGTPQGAAWCAVDLALLDAFGRAARVPVRLSERNAPPKRLRYSVVLSSSAGWKTLLATRLMAIRQVKLKVETGSEEAGALRTRRWLGRRCDVRADANMAWSVERGLEQMAALGRLGIHSYEQPLPAEDLEGLARLVRESGQGVMADESLNDRESLQRLIEQRACTAVNVRISKCGGLVAALHRCREALAAGLDVQVGCQVGETSLLSAAHLVLLSAVDPVKYAEGCFGKLLLREDPAEPVLQFGFAGRPPALPARPGLGVEMNRAVIDRWTTREATVA